MPFKASVSSRALLLSCVFVMSLVALIALRVSDIVTFFPFFAAILAVGGVAYVIRWDMLAVAVVSITTLAVVFLSRPLQATPPSGLEAVFYMIMIFGSAALAIWTAEKVSEATRAVTPARSPF